MESAFGSGSHARRWRRVPNNLAIILDRSCDTPLQRQLYNQVRAAILAGSLKPGDSLPATRALADELQCSRNTILGAFSQLMAEGYLTGKGGAGTFVAHGLPVAPVLHSPRITKLSEPTATLSNVGEAIAGLLPSRRENFTSFVPSVPEVGLFPFQMWGQLLSVTWTNPSQLVACYRDSRGWGPLRDAITDHLRSTRVVDCESDQVIITTGTQNSIDMTARLLLNPGDVAWIEDPCYPGIKSALIAAGVRIIPVPVDHEGMNIEDVPADTPLPRLIVVAPSHQYPLGCVMPLKRRLQLLAFAERINALILEDDYDSEFRYKGEPLASMQGLDGGRRTIYVGTFSKTMFPAIRLGFLVLPKRLAPRFALARAGLDIQPSMIAQPAVAQLINQGHLGTHIRRMRVIYSKRQEALIRALEKHGADFLTPEPQETGLHLIARLKQQVALTDREASRRAQMADIIAPALSDYSVGRFRGNALLLGFGATPEAAMEDRVGRLVRALAQ